jgi:hypothetical protein
MRIITWASVSAWPNAFQPSSSFRFEAVGGGASVPVSGAVAEHACSGRSSAAERRIGFIATSGTKA